MQTEKLATLRDKPSSKPISADRPMLPFAADATHDPEDPLRDHDLNNDKKYDSSNNSNTQLGDVSNVQNALPNC